LFSNPDRQRYAVTSSNVYVDLKDLSLRGGEHFERTFAVRIAPITLGGERYDVLAPNGVDLVVDRVAGGFLIKVMAVVTTYGPCARCLREVVLNLRAEEQEFVPTCKEGWDEADVSDFVEDMVVDLSGLVREAIVLATPARIVCREECRGLCQLCGHDLNEGPCGCPPVEVDDRWAKLKDFTGETTPSP
jgi:uncharacterized protein